MASVGIINGDHIPPHLTSAALRSQGQAECGVVRRVGCDGSAPAVGPLAVLTAAPLPIDAIACTSCAVEAPAVVKASPDGYTLLLITGAYTTNATLYDNLSYNLSEASTFSATISVRQWLRLSEFFPVSHPSPAQSISHSNQPSFGDRSGRLVEILRSIRADDVDPVLDATLST